MTDFDSEFDRLESQFSGLEDSFGGLESVAGAFRKELQGVRSSFEQTGQEASPGCPRPSPRRSSQLSKV